MGFFDLLEARVTSIDSLLCVGLDPHPNQLSAATGQAAFDFCKRLVDATLPVAAAYKPNVAFFEAFGSEGWDALGRLIKSIPPEIPVLLDAKRGDISTTAEAYANAAIKLLGSNGPAGGVTLHGYMGYDSIEPFLKDPNLGVFVLCKTSNPTADQLQTLPCTGKDGNSRLLYEEVAKLASNWSSQSGGRVGVVVGATDVEALRRVRAIVPDMWILAPGIGAQGGDLDAACEAGLSPSTSSKLLIPISRAISKADDPFKAADEFRVAINNARKACRAPAPASSSSSLPSTLAPYQRDFINFTLQQKVLRFGTFTLKSGRSSPYFFNAGLFTTGHSLKRLGHFYAQALMAAGMVGQFDVIFGPAYKGITLASCVAMALAETTGVDVPFAYNRKEAKDHGEGGVIVGAALQGQRVLIVDDVITAGTAIRESMDLLHRAGARPVAVALALDRQEKGPQGQSQSAVQSVEAEYGLRVISIVSLNHLLSFLEDGSMGQATLMAIKQYRQEYGIN